MKFSIDRERKEIAQWLMRPALLTVLFEIPLEEIQQFLSQQPCMENAGSLAFNLSLVSHRYANMALHSAKTSQTECQQYWNLFVDYITSSMRIRVLRIEHRQGDGSIGAYDLHSHFTLLLGSGLIEAAAWLGLRIYESIKRHMKHPVVYELREISEADLERPLTGDDDPRNLNRESISAYTESPLCGFVLRMWLVLTGRREPADRLPDGVPQCGIYGALFQDWDHAEKLADAISAACDFHIVRMKEDRRIPYDIAEFDTSPFRQIPFEILAYRNLRRHLGLETPFPAHPLLDSPFVKSLPNEIKPSGDPLLARVLEYSRKVLPEL